MKLRVARSSHFVIDLLDLCRLMWNVRFDKHKKSSFHIYFSHYTVRLPPEDLRKLFTERGA